MATSPARPWSSMLSQSTDFRGQDGPVADRHAEHGHSGILNRDEVAPARARSVALSRAGFDSRWHRRAVVAARDTT